MKWILGQISVINYYFIIIIFLSGSIANNTITCPIPFLGVFGYTYDTGSGNLCYANNSYLDVCSEKTTMMWNYTLCSQIQAYSCKYFFFLFKHLIQKRKPNTSLWTAPIKKVYHKGWYFKNYSKILVSKLHCRSETNKMVNDIVVTL